MTEGFYPPKFKDPPKKAQGQKEVEASGTIVQLARLLGLLPGPDEPADTLAFERVGKRIVRKWPRLSKALGVKE